MFTHMSNMIYQDVLTSLTNIRLDHSIDDNRISPIDSALVLPIDGAWPMVSDSAILIHASWCIVRSLQSHCNPCNTATWHIIRSKLPVTLWPIVHALAKEHVLFFYYCTATSVAIRWHDWLISNEWGGSSRRIADNGYCHARTLRHAFTLCRSCSEFFSCPYGSCQIHCRCS